MKRSLLLLTILSLFVQTQAQVTRARTGDLQFIPNTGQWQDPSLFHLGLYGGTLFLEKDKFTYTFSNIGDLGHYKHEPELGDPKDFIIKKHAFQTQFIGSDPMTQVRGEDAFSGYYNYFLGNDPSMWRGKVPAYAAVRYSGLYPGVDLVVYSKSNSLKYDLEIAAGADPELIRLQYSGLDSMAIVDGNLELFTSINKLVEQAPIAWQIIDGVKTFVDCQFVLQGNVVQFVFPNGYKAQYPIVIDPATLIFASYSGSTSDNWGYTATYDSDGYLYGGGIAFADGYPVTIGAVQESYSGPGGYVADVTVSKFEPDGTDLVYSTYLGGTGQDLPYSLIVNADNELIIYGSTGSSNFPTVAGCYDGTFNGGSSVTVDVVLNFTSGSDAFISRLSADGGALLASTYFGGTSNDALNTGTLGYNYGDHARGEVVTDNFGNIYIAGVTRSPNLPVTAGVLQPTIGGAQDGFIAKFNVALSSLTWSSFIGGTADDGAYSIKKMIGDKFVICGGTSSTNLNTSAGAYLEDYAGGSADGYLLIIPGDASSIMSMTYLGTNQYDQAFLTEVDEENHIYVTGQTRGAYPVVGAVYSNAGSAQYISKLDSTLSVMLLSTVFGDGTNVVNISPTAFLVDNCDNIFVAGWGGNVNIGYNFETGTVNDMPITGDAFQSSTDGSDFYLIVFAEDLESLSYATYFGGPISDEHVDGGTSRFDKSGVVYHAVCAGCGGSDDFPTTEGVVSNTNNATNCNLGVFKFALAIPPTTSGFTLDPNSGCYPVDVNFTNLSDNAISYDWDFGDGTVSTEENPSHSYDTPGEYTVTLVANADGLCGVNDTSEATVTVFDYPTAGFTYGPNPASVFTPVFFTDASTDAVTWLWEFGDGFTSTEENPYHLYAETGSYYVCQTVTNADGCTDKICDSVIIYAISILEVPNAFSPNNDGINDEFIPLNYGLLNYEFRIYNRWGELIFETNDTTKGWNGIYNGVEQELDVYVYVVSGNGEDGVHYSKQGNFTLVR